MMIETVAQKSLKNCHVVGLDSIMLDDTPGARIRVFYANETHELYQNQLPFRSPLSVAIHPHHCAITIIPIFGDIYNVVERDNGCNVELAEFLFQSQITTGKGGFTATGNKRKMSLEAQLITQPVGMTALEVHTVYVPRGEKAAWFIYEHADDPAYRPLAWSNTALDTFDFSKLYKPMDVEYLRPRLKELRKHCPELAFAI